MRDLWVDPSRSRGSTFRDPWVDLSRVPEFRSPEPGSLPLPLSARFLYIIMIATMTKSSYQRWYDLSLYPFYYHNIVQLTAPSSKMASLCDFATPHARLSGLRRHVGDDIHNTSTPTCARRKRHDIAIKNVVLVQVLQYTNEVTDRSTTRLRFRRRRVNPLANSDGDASSQILAESSWGA